MLATRYKEPGQDCSSVNKHIPGVQKLSALRMSKPYASSLSAHSEWPVPFRYPQQHATIDGISSYDRCYDGSAFQHSEPAMEKKSPKVDVELKEEGQQEGTRAARDDPDPKQYPSTMDEGRVRSGLNYITPVRIPTLEPALEPKAPGTEALGEQWLEREPSHDRLDQDITQRDDDDDCMEEDGDEGDVDTTRGTAAERRAERRKMKRFRLTHQQTRFLMSEFVKQPHPDASHRDRLSREIPGLSPRQVQVWFQNRRAKIKRMNAEDRDRVIQMRAVPEDFDNIQALHSPYGAVHGLGHPAPSASEIGTPQFGEQINRSLMVDVRRPDSDDNLSSAGLTPSFDTVGFGAGGTSSPGMISPPSSTSHDRFDLYGSHFPSGIGINSRGASGFVANQGRMGSSTHSGRQQIRQLQPLHIRETPIRPRTEAIQSPLRSGLTWKGDTIDYSNYQTAHSATSAMLDRHNSMYQLGASTTANTGSYDTDTYSGTSGQSNQSLGYPSFPPTSPDRPRLRASSATFPLNLDLRHQYGMANQKDQSSLYTFGHRTPSTSAQFASPSIYTTSYPPAPLTAPINMAQHSGHDHQKTEVSGSSQSIAGSEAYMKGNQTNAAGDASPITTRGSQNNTELSFEPQDRTGSYGQHLSPTNFLQRRSSFPVPGGLDEQRNASTTPDFQQRTSNQ